MKKLLLILTILFAFQICATAEEQTPFQENEEQKTDNQEVSQDTFDREQAVTNTTFKISNVDKTGTGKSELNIFTPLYGETTNTDKKGFEAVVVNNKVVKLNQYNSYIPKNGYVISGHGSAKKFITKNLFEGADVEIDFDKGELTVLTHSDNYMIEAIYQLNKAKELVSAAKDNSFEKEAMEFYVNRADEILYRTKKLIQFKDYEKAAEMAKDSMVYSDRAFYYSLPFVKDEFKAVWISPTQKSKDEVTRDFDAVKHMYVNNIFIDVFSNGSTVYKSDVAKEYGLSEQNEDYKDFDVLAEWVKLAQLNDINVYFSFNTFNLGRPKQSTINTNIVKVHPDWLINQNVKKGEEYFINPDNQQAQEFLFDLLREVSEKYDVAGVNINGLNIKGKEAAITNFVNKLTQRNFINNLSINVYSENMDIKNWNLNDNITLMPVLTSSSTEFAKNFLTQVKYNTKVKNIYPVYMQSYQDELPRKFFDQVAISRELGFNGIVIYDLDCMTKEFFSALRFCIFKEPSTKKQFVLYERK